ncbi:MAG: hypothetical protein COB45_00720 [Gammaproteobacteria bacterium]|jgi:hypothetical protein|nr:MAG: hypothetical protein COB45_00720 [Gammaproteobacteria bacterium]PHR85213.1 MAG: hypothetical protein COA59_02275 [Colwellia sp.]
MYQWQSLLADGNDCFHKKDWSQAEYYYKDAAFCLELLCATNTKDIQLLMGWICALHNLATLFEVQNNPDLSLKYLLIPHNRMLSITASNEQCEDMKLIASNALKITFMPILMFSKRHPICPSCQQSLEEFKQNLEAQQCDIH